MTPRTRYLIRTVCALVLFFAPHSLLRAQGGPVQPGALSIYYEELTAPDFVRALDRSAATCILPIGVLEKHGPHMPLGTDLLDARELAARAARKEYAVLFPPYYFSQIFEARHQPGTISYSQKLMWDVLQETCDELGRNGFKKIVLVNGHGGNNSFLPYFCQSQLAARKSYAVFLFRPSQDPETAAEVKKMRKTTMESHAGEVETSTLMAHRPELVRLDQAKNEPGTDLQRMAGLTAIGDGLGAIPGTDFIDLAIISRNLDQPQW